MSTLGAKRQSFRRLWLQAFISLSLGAAAAVVVMRLAVASMTS